MLSAIRGAVGFLTRAPVGHDGTAWEAFRATPAAFTLVGYPVGAAAALAFLAPLPSATTAALFPAWLYFLTGINHLDGVADLGDALVVHGDAARRREVLADTTVGVGAVAAVTLVVVGLAAAGFALADRPLALVAIVLSAEVGAKTGVALAACLGAATHDGLGAQFTARLGPRDAVLPVALALPAAVLTWPHPAAAATLVGPLALGVAVVPWGRRRLGGVDGDLLGATAELARLLGLHLGVIAWTLW